MTAAEDSLHTLDYRIDIAELGDLTLYPLTAEFATAWDRFATAVRRRAQRDDITPSYSYLATALTAVTGQPVRLFPSYALARQQSDRGIAALLVTTGAIQPAILTTATQAFERMSVGDDRANTLAPFLADVIPAIEPLAKYIGYEEGIIRAPGWVYEVARWSLAARIVRHPLLIDGHLPIRFRPDTDGNLLAWDHPIARTWSTGPCHAMIYVSTAVVTLPGAAGLYLRLDAHVARQPLTWWGVRNAWIDTHPGNQDKPVLHLPVRPAWPAKGRDHPQYGAFAAGIVQECQLNPIPALPDEAPRNRGPVRLIGKPRKHPVGKGPGARLMFQLQGHALEQLGLPDLAYHRTKITMAAAGTGILPASKIDDAITAAPDERSRIARLRIVCFYDSQLTRHRMADALGHYSATGPGVLAGAADDQPVSLTNRLSILFHRDPGLLAHGQHTRNLGGLACLTPPKDGAVIALAETIWEPGSTIEDDAKPLLRAAFGKQGVVSQFLNASYTPAKPRRAKDGTVTQPHDHAAEAAVRDLLRQAGLTDNRLATATAGTRLTYPLTRAATLVGVHIRQHTPRRRNGRNDPNRLVVQLVAIHATPDDAPWAVQMHDDAEGWISYREANARYYATDIGNANFGRSRDRAPFVREYVDQALAALPKTKPLVVFVDTGACRGIWSGLNHVSFGHATLPGSASNHPDLAVVRCASGENVPRPTHRSHGPKVLDGHKPDLPRTSLYEHDEGGVRSWLLAQPSRVHRSAQVGSRAGTDYTRWTLPDTREAWMARDWHALTSIEIAVAQPGSWQPDELAALTARLCHQAASWDDRTLLPVPLHLAKASDQDHPGHPPDEEQQS
jgi:hypothetical protein